MTISSATTGASIRYTTDGRQPSETAGTLYSGPITVSTTTMINAIAYLSGVPDSTVASATFTIGGLARAIQIHPTTPTTMWAAGAKSGIWKSTDGGNTWMSKYGSPVSSLLLDPRNSSHLYAGTGEGFSNPNSQPGSGVLQSNDGGETWALLPSTATSDFYYAQKFTMSKGASQRLYAATRTGIFRSTDAGTSWQKVLDATGVNGCMDITMQTDRGLAMVLAACGTLLPDGSTTAAVYRAVDTSSPMTWTAVLNPANMGRTSLAFAPSNQNIIYAISASNSAADNFNQGLLAVINRIIRVRPAPGPLNLPTPAPVHRTRCCSPML